MRIFDHLPNSGKKYNDSLIAEQREAKLVFLETHIEDIKHGINKKDRNAMLSILSGTYAIQNAGKKEVKLNISGTERYTQVDPSISSSLFSEFLEIHELVQKRKKNEPVLQ